MGPCELRTRPAGLCGGIPPHPLLCQPCLGPDVLLWNMCGQVWKLQALSWGPNAADPEAEPEAEPEAVPEAVEAPLEAASVE